VRTIEAEVQLKIIDLLPDDHATALELVSQLLANVALSSDQPWELQKVLDEVARHYSSYQEA
jgi:hypothetical protein